MGKLRHKRGNSVMRMTPGLPNMDCIGRHFLAGPICAVKLNLKLISAPVTVRALMTLHRAILIPMLANGYEDSDKIPKNLFALIILSVKWEKNIHILYTHTHIQDTQ